jgi:hypothetical protein
VERFTPFAFSPNGEFNGMFDEQSGDDFFDGLFVFFGQVLDFFPVSD